MSQSQKQPPTQPTPETNPPPSQPEPETKILTATTETATSSDAIEPDWDTIKTPEELQAEKQEAELTAIVEGEENEERERFNELAKKGMHLIMTGTMHGARMGINFKLGHELKSLDPEQYKPGLRQAHDCMVDLMELDPDGMFGKVLAWVGGIDERWAPILIAYAAIGQNVKAELAAINKAEKEKKKAEKPAEDPIGQDAPPPPPQNTEPKPIGVSQP